MLDASVTIGTFAVSDTFAVLETFVILARKEAKEERSF